MKKNKSAPLLIGSMLFGLFFGAGNLIFPVHMGQEAGQNVVVATLGFLITGTGLPFLGVVAMGLTGSRNVLEFGSRVHKGFGYIMAILLYLTIGPFFALPRTATVSFEVGLVPILPAEWVRPALAGFTILFFAAALFFSLRPARILDWVGKILNPIFLAFIGFLLIKAVVNPMGQAALVPALGAYQTGAFPKGFIEGYQTMDVLAALAFGSIVVEQIKMLGITEPREIAKSTAKSGLVTVILMCLIYGGLAWLGASSVGLPLAVSENGGLALAQISRHYLGGFGSIFLAVTITVACLKTAIGLITSCSGAFVAMYPKSFGYRTYAVIFAVFACVVANVGLTQLIALSLPMLMLLYPPAITLVLLSFFERFFGKRQVVFVCATIGSLLVGVADALMALPKFLVETPFVQGVQNFYVRYVPFFQEGFGWMLPMLAGLIVGLVLSRLTLPREKPTTS